MFYFKKKTKVIQKLETLKKEIHELLTSIDQPAAVASINNLASKTTQIKKSVSFTKHHVKQCGELAICEDLKRCLALIKSFFNETKHSSAVMHQNISEAGSDEATNVVNTNCVENTNLIGENKLLTEKVAEFEEVLSLTQNF